MSPSFRVWPYNYMTPVKSRVDLIIIRSTFIRGEQLSNHWQSSRVVLVNIRMNLKYNHTFQDKDINYE